MEIDRFLEKTFLITGGTGSFGNAVLRHLTTLPIKELRVFSRDEKKQDDMRLALRNPKLKFLIGDVRLYESIFDALKGVDYVFHAAALKQVPSCEFYPMEAVRTNIIGADNVMRAAKARGVKKLVVLSTDKAVYPINAMGISKAMMEKLMVAGSQWQGESDTTICATRYGNVMGSRGSVIPLFAQQIREGKSVTITDPNMTRFLMSLEDSVNLVMKAFIRGLPGDIFVQKAPASTIIDLAKAVSECLGMRPSIDFIGTRHGEKLYESLISREEMLRAEDLGDYFRISADTRDLNYDKYFSAGDSRIESLEDYTSHNTKRLTIPEVVRLLHSSHVLD
jgi:UDP-N-acetylglucosamine 4,6-dehydratase